MDLLFPQLVPRPAVARDRVQCIPDVYIFKILLHIFTNFCDLFHTVSKRIVCHNKFSCSAHRRAHSVWAEQARVLSLCQMRLQTPLSPFLSLCRPKLQFLCLSRFFPPTYEHGRPILRESRRILHTLQHRERTDNVERYSWRKGRGIFARGWR